MKKTLLLKLKSLLGTESANRTADQKAELDLLQTKAANAGIKLDTKSLNAALRNAPEDDEMTEDEVQDVVTKAVKSAITDELDKKAVSADAIKDIVDESLKSASKSAPKMEFHTQGSSDGGPLDFPVEHRAGNLSIAAKQLLNVCLMKVSEDALAEQGTKRPSSINDGIGDRLQARSKAVGDNFQARLKTHGMKALTTDGAASGAELVYVDLSTDLQQRLYLTSQLAAVMQGKEIPMPTDPFKLPIKTVRTDYTVGSESPTPASLAAYFQQGSPTLGNITLDAKKMIGIASYSYESNEDSVIAILPMLQADLGDGAAAAFERSVISGDTAGTHMDTGPAYGATAVESLYDGIRKAGIAGGVTNFAAAIGRANFLGLRGSMGKYGTNPNDLVIIVSPSGYTSLQAVEEQFRAEARGNVSAANIAVGSIASFNGIRVIVSEFMPTGVTVGGIDTGSATPGTDDKDSMIITNLGQWLCGTRRGFTVEVTADPLVQTNYVVASFRRAVAQKEASAAARPHTVMAVNF
jgi:HK97 family phage major capsid protein